MTQSNFALASSSWDDREYSAMQDVIKSGRFTMGEKVREFERAFASHFGSRYAVMSNSGSSANLLAVAAMRYRRSGKPGSRNTVIVPAVSWSTTYYPLHQLGYTLKFVDIDAGTLNASAESIRKAIDDTTVGIFAVNLLGNPSELTEIRQLARDNNLFLLEDNCESMGASIDGKFAGTFGEIGTFSSFFSHHISTMEGGMCVTDDEELAQVMISMRAHGWTRELPNENFVANKTGNAFEDSFRFVLPGYNVRPLELSGAIGIEQLRKLDNLVEERRLNAQYFLEGMRTIEGVDTQVESGISSWFGFSLVLRGSNEGRRSELVKAFNEHGIECRPIVAGNFTKNPVLHHLNHVPVGQMVNAEYIDRNGLFVGNHHFDIGNSLDLLLDVLRGFVKQTA